MTAPPAPPGEQSSRLLRETRDAYDPTGTRMQSRLTRRLAQLALLDEEISPAASAEAELMCQAALEEAEGLDSREVAELLLTVWRNLGVDQLAERQALVKRLRELIGSERDQTFRRAAAAYADVVDQMELGNLAGADAALPEFLAAEKEIRSRTEVEAIFRVMRAALQGHFSEAEERLRDIDAFMQKLGHEDTRRILTHNTLLFGLHCTQGLLNEMLDLLRMTAAWSPHAMLQTSLPYGCAQAGLLDEARNAFRRSEEAPLARDQNWLVVQALRAEACVRSGERASARALYRELLPFADRVAVVGGLYVCLGAVARPLVLLADAVGDADQSGSTSSRQSGSTRGWALGPGWRVARSTTPRPSRRAGHDRRGNAPVICSTMRRAPRKLSDSAIGSTGVRCGRRRIESGHALHFHHGSDPSLQHTMMCI